ncbi:MAG TPA: histidine triad nucleotide-binding protein [Nitrospiria bacterium]|nr:histidine triad nucleotide-binding protein [Nitrospiria bacterium]
MKDCLFCRIINREIPGKIVAEDDRSIALEDINPQAPVHLLVIPRKHIDRLSSLADGDLPLIGHLFLVANRLASERGISEAGYRTVINSGREAGQTVFHLHLHMMGGRAFRWPPG